MHLSLKTILAFLDHLFDAEYQKAVERRIAEQESAIRLVNRIHSVVRQPGLGVPGRVGEKEELSANHVAAYLDHQLSDVEIAQFEAFCLRSDICLAEVASTHQILTTVLGQPATLKRECRLRLYGIQNHQKNRHVALQQQMATFQAAQQQVMNPQYPQSSPQESRIMLKSPAQSPMNPAETDDHNSHLEGHNPPKTGRRITVEVTPMPSHHAGEMSEEASFEERVPDKPLIHVSEAFAVWKQQRRYAFLSFAVLILLLAGLGGWSLFHSNDRSKLTRNQSSFPGLGMSPAVDDHGNRDRIEKNAPVFKVETKKTEPVSDPSMIALATTSPYANPEPPSSVTQYLPIQGPVVSDNPPKTPSSISQSTLSPSTVLPQTLPPLPQQEPPQIAFASQIPVTPPFQILPAQTQFAGISSQQPQQSTPIARQQFISQQNIPVGAISGASNVSSGTIAAFSSGTPQTPAPVSDVQNSHDSTQNLRASTSSGENRGSFTPVKEQNFADTKKIGGSPIQSSPTLSLQLIDRGNYQSVSEAIRRSLPSVKPAWNNENDQSADSQKQELLENNRMMLNQSEILRPDSPMTNGIGSGMEKRITQNDSVHSEPAWNERNDLFEPFTTDDASHLTEEKNSGQLAATRWQIQNESHLSSENSQVRLIANDPNLSNDMQHGIRQTNYIHPEMTSIDPNAAPFLQLSHDDLALVRETPESNWVWLPASKHLFQDILLVPAPFRASVILPNGIVIETEGDTRFRMIPPDERQTPGIAFDCGHLTIYAVGLQDSLQKQDSSRDVSKDTSKQESPDFSKSLRIMTPVGGGTLRLTDTSSIVCIDSENRTSTKLLRVTRSYESVTSNPHFFEANSRSGVIYCPNMMIYPGKGQTVYWLKDDAAQEWTLRSISIFPLDLEKAFQPVILLDLKNVLVLPASGGPSLVSHDGLIPVSKLDLKNQFVTMPQTFIPTPSKTWLLD
ncbi:MAG: hypothetical protein FWC50_09760 [Planctomycetaceae bacterium]|nr:hypothetical protein [Planctomycetaceae bacterium]